MQVALARLYCNICVSRHSKLITITFGCFECLLTSLGSQVKSYTFEPRVTHLSY